MDQISDQIFGPDFGPDFGLDFGPDFGPDFGTDFGPDFGPNVLPLLISNFIKLFGGDLLCEFIRTFFFGISIFYHSSNLTLTLICYGQG